MEEVKYQWSARVPDGHMWLQLTFKVHFQEGDQSETFPSTEAHFNDAGLGLSEEMKRFLSGCNGAIHIDKKEFTVFFSDAEDFMRFKLVGLPDKTRSIC